MRYRAIYFFVIGVAMGLQAGLAAAGGMDSPRVVAFKRAVGFDEALARSHHHDDEYIHVDWMHLDVPPQLTGWKIGTRELQPTKEDGSRTFYWQFERGNELLTIVAEVHRPGTDAAGRNFLEIANATTTLAIPYMAGPKDLGLVSAVGQARSDGVFWFDRNVCVEVTRSQTNISYMDIAYWLQEAMRKSVIRIAR